MISAISAFIAVGQIALPTAQAGSSAVGENGSVPLSRAGAFTAKADDATAMVHNPAGTAKLRRPTFFIGSSLIQSKQSFTRTGTYQADPLYPESGDYAGLPFPTVEGNQSSPIPMLIFQMPLTDKLVVGGGIFAPHFGSPGTFPTDVLVAGGIEAPAPQRYDYVNIAGLVVLPSLSLGYSVTDHLRVGARVSSAYADVSATIVTQALANEAEQPSYDTLVDLTLKDPFTFAFGLGIQYDVDDFEFGAAYNSEVRLGLKGKASVRLDGLLASVVEIEPLADSEAACAPGGTAGALSACVSYVIPANATLGARWIAKAPSGVELGDIEFDVRWENWASADKLSATLDGRDTLQNNKLGTTTANSGFNDVYAFRLGGSRHFFMEEGYKLTLRGGLGYDTAAAPTSWTRVGTDGTPHVTLAGGVGVAFGRWQLDFGASYIAAPRRVVRDQLVLPGTSPELRNQPDIPSTAINGIPPANPYNAGVYNRSYLLGSVGLSVLF